MTQMAANMDPKVMENMMSTMGGGPSNVDTAQALEQMKNMTPDQLKAGMAQAQNQMSAQKQYWYNASEMLKNEGNAEVKKECYPAALAKYTKALENIQGHVGDDVAVLRVILLNNIALCHLKTKDFAQALQAGEDALKVDPKSFKALFRRGQAREALGSLEDAVMDIRQAAELAPNDKAISRELERLRGELKERGISEENLKPAATTHEVSPAWQSASTTPSASSGSRAAGGSSSSSSGGSSGRKDWAEAAERLAENPDMLKQATDMMSKLSPEQLQSMMDSSALPPGMDAATMKSQMEHLQKNPDMLQNAMDSLKAMPPEDRKKILAQHRSQSDVKQDPSAMSSLFENPEMMQQALQMTKEMSPELLEKLNINSPEEADMMKSAAEQMASNPELTKQMADMMKNIPPEQLQQMMNLSSRMRGKSDGASLPEGVDPTSILNDPDMMKATEEMMKSMSPETLASMARASGMDISEDNAKVVARFLPWLMKLMRVAGHLKRMWSVMWSPRGRMVLAVVVLLFAVYQHYRG
mmetsp:Transcript_86481/g.224587  ORF Transcript_86481/g.224587 Transcript_86481/m.224587 type:complete len:528 (-) Transcript_86481:90-1673(-)